MTVVPVLISILSGRACMATRSMLTSWAGGAAGAAVTAVAAWETAGPMGTTTSTNPSVDSSANSSRRKRDMPMGVLQGKGR